MKNLFFILILALTAISAKAENEKWDFPNEELHQLDRTIAKAPQYEKDFNHRVDSIEKLMNRRGISIQSKVEKLMQITSLYRQTMTDSSLLYARKAVMESTSAGGDLKYRAALSYADALGAAGVFDEAIEILDSLRSESAAGDKKMKIWYYSVGRRVFSNACGYMQGLVNIEKKYRTRYIECDDSLVNLLPSGDNYRNFILAERMVENGDLNDSKHLLEALMKKLPTGDNIYGMAAYQMALIYWKQGNQNAYASYLAKAAESDIQGGVREGFALPALAVWLYQQEKIDLAFKYINYALEEAYKGNARVRMVSLARWVPDIDEAYRRDISASHNELAGYGVIITIMFIALMLMFVLLFKEVKKSREAHRVLKSTSKLKDNYIGNFIGLCSTYSEKYHSLIKLVDRKISSGQASELLQTLKSGKMGDGDDENFYKEIDSVVLTLYPNFVEKINELLEPSERIKTQRGILTPELRIYAFVRLGVSESTKIAKILNYSVHTVYAYRNRMRNRAVDRDKFEENILKIGLD